MVDPKQTNLFDPYEHVLSEAARRMLDEGWEGVFRHVVLELMPVGQVAEHFHDSQGRPTKELYSMAGLIFIMQFNDWTVERAAKAYMLDNSVQYALNLVPAMQSLSTRTLERYIKLVREDGLAALIQERVTTALVGALEIQVSKQRLDSTHLFSDMAVFGRTQLMGVGIKRFVAQVRRHDPAAYEALPESLRARYAPSPDRLFGEVARDKESRQGLRQTVAEEMHELIERFTGVPPVCQWPTYLALRRVFEQQCLVEPSEEEDEKVVVKEKAGGAVIQNPSDPDATYDGKKGSGYQVQLSETCHEDNEVQLVTYVQPQTAAEPDSEAVLPALEALEEHGLMPEELSADTAYGSDGNVQHSQSMGVELVSPVNRSKLDPGQLNVGDFTIDPGTETVEACPAGHAPLDSTYDPEIQKTVTHMDVAVCQDCPMRDQCPMAGKQTRTFRHTPAERRRAQRRRDEETDAFKDAYRKRGGIEATNSCIKRCTGMGRLRVRGKPAVFMAIYLKIVGWNILRAASAKKMRQKVAQIIKSRHPNPIPSVIRQPNRACWALLRALWAPLRDAASFATDRTRRRPRPCGSPGFDQGLLSVASSKGDLGRCSRDDSPPLKGDQGGCCASLFV